MRIQDDYGTAYTEVLYQLIEESFLFAQLSADGQFLDINGRFREVFHYTLEDLYMKNCTMLLEGHVYDVEGIASSIHQGEMWRGETCFITKYGELKYLESTFLPLLDVDGSVGKVLSFHIDRTDQKSAIKWKQIAFRNELTNLPNRRKLMEVLEFYIDNSSEFSVINIDIDHFKKVNDTYGHAIGDRLLYQIGRRLSNLPVCKENVFHVSGDEFIILLRNISDIERQIEAIHTAFRVGFVVEELELKVSTSIGISLFPIHSKDPGRLLELADSAMYKAKSLKRN